MQRLKAAWERYNAGILAITGITLALLIIFLICHANFRSVATDIRGYYSDSDSVMAARINEADTVRSCVKGMYSQFYMLQKFKEEYIFVADQYQVIYFCCEVLLIITTILLAIIGSGIATTGWNASRPIFRTLFMIFFFYTSFFGLIPKIFNNEDNAQKSISRYFALTNLQTDIFNVIGVKPSTAYTPQMDTIQCKVFNDINANMKSNRDLYIDIKAENLPAKINPMQSITPDQPKTTSTEEKKGSDSIKADSAKLHK